MGQRLYDWHRTEMPVPRLPSGTTADFASQPDCPLCRFIHFAITGGPRNVTAEAHHGEWRKRGGFRIGRIGTYLSFIEDSSSLPWLPKRGRVIKKTEIDPGLISKWIRSCETVHRSECAPLTLQVGNSSGLKVFRLVDVTKNCVVETSDSDKQYRYLALSYMWGHTEQVVRLLTTNRDTLMRPGGLQQTASVNLLPKTIQDAIELVRLVGEQYLWIDSLCLLQDDLEDMTLSIPFMDMIYRGAFATIIAASGTDANAGIPGIRPRTRQAEQYVEEVVPGVKMVVLRELDEYLSVSRYATRGWTLVSIDFPFCQFIINYWKAS